MGFVQTRYADDGGDSAVAALKALNAVSFTGEHVQSALVVLRCLPREDQFDPAAQAEAIADYAAATGIVSPIAAPALHARIIALNKWTAEHDPRHDSDAVTVTDAAATCPLIDGGKGISFDPDRFAETMALVADMLW